VDETYIKVKGEWKYLYRAVDSAGNTLNFLLTVKRDAQAAKRFFRKALKACHKQEPRVITLIPKPSMNSKQKELPQSVELRQEKYLNDIIELSASGHKTISQTPDGIRLI